MWPAPEKAGDGCWGVHVHTPEGLQITSSGVGSLGCVPSAGTCRLRARGQSLGLQSGIPPLWRDSRSSCVQMGRGTKRRAPCMRPHFVLSTQTVLTCLWNYASSRLSGVGRGEWRRIPKFQVPRGGQTAFALRLPYRTCHWTIKSHLQLPRAASCSPPLPPRHGPALPSFINR